MVRLEQPSSMNGVNTNFAEQSVCLTLEYQDWGNLPIFHQRLNEVKICRNIWSVQKNFVPLHQKKQLNVKPIKTERIMERPPP